MDLFINTNLNLDEIDPYLEPSLIEIINRNKLTNIELIRAMDRIEELVLNNNVTKSDIEYLKSIDLEYHFFRCEVSVYEKHGFEIRRSILEATLIEAYSKAELFFGDKDAGFFNNRLYNYKVKFMKIGIETEFMLEYLAKLENSLGSLRSDFQNAISEMSDLYSIYNIKDIIKKAHSEPNLLKRKQIFVDTIVECDLLCLELYLEDFEEVEHQDIIQKCKKASYKKGYLRSMCIVNKY